MQNTTTMFLSSFAHMATVGSCDQTVRSGRGFFAKSGVQGCPRHGGPGILPGGLILKDRMLGHLPLAISTPFRFALLGCGSLLRVNQFVVESRTRAKPQRRKGRKDLDFFDSEKLCALAALRETLQSVWIRVHPWFSFLDSGAKRKCEHRTEEEAVWPRTGRHLIRTDTHRVEHRHS